MTIWFQAVFRDSAMFWYNCFRRCFDTIFARQCVEKWWLAIQNPFSLYAADAATQLLRYYTANSNFFAMIKSLHNHSSISESEKNGPCAGYRCHCCNDVGIHDSAFRPARSVSAGLQLVHSLFASLDRGINQGKDPNRPNFNERAVSRHSLDCSSSVSRNSM